MITNTGEPKLIDFGCSYRLPLPESEEAVRLYTLTYRPPEVAFSANQDQKTKIGYPGDIWALGVIMWEIYQKQRLFILKEADLENEDDVISAAMYTALYGEGATILRLVNEARQTPLAVIPLRVQVSHKIDQFKEDKFNTAFPIAMMLDINPEKRPSAGGILNYLRIAQNNDLIESSIASNDLIKLNISSASHDPAVLPPPTGLVLLEKYDIIGPIPGVFVDSELRKKTLLWLLSFNYQLRLKNGTLFYAIILLDSLSFVKRLTETNITYYAIVCLRIAEEYKEMAYYNLKDYLLVGGTMTVSLFNRLRNEIYQAIDYKLYFTTVYDYYRNEKKRSSNLLIFMFCALLLPRQELMLAEISSQKELFTRIASLGEKIKSCDNFHNLLDDFELRVFEVAYENKSIHKLFRLPSSKE